MERRSWGSAAHRIIEQFAEALAEIAVDFERSRRTRHFQEALASWQSLNFFSLASHRSLDLKRTSFQLANEGRVYLRADRVSIFDAGSYRTKLLASSGLASFDSRSDLVRQLRGLAKRTAKHGQPVFVQEQSLDAPRGLQQRIDQYIAKSNAKQLALIPLMSSSEGGRQQGVVGVAAIELIQVADPTEFLERCQQFALHASSAFARSKQFNAIPFRPVWAGMGWCLSQLGLRRIPRTLIVLALLAAMIAPLILVQADFKIEARGELRPVVERFVYASTNGFVTDMNVGHGSLVSEGSPLVSLYSPELELERETLDGELRTTNQKIDGLVVALGQVDPSDDQALLTQSQIGAEINELEQRVLNLDQQRQMVQAQLDRLNVASPIAGEVVTWEVEQLLRTRPVRQGDALLKIADTTGDWRLELHVADRDIGHVLDAQNRSKTELELEFVLETNPRKKCVARIESIAASTSVAAGELPFVVVSGSFDKTEVTQLRPGATVVAKIDCGRRSLGYVWLHDMIDAFNRRVFW